MTNSVSSSVVWAPGSIHSGSSFTAVTDTTKERTTVNSPSLTVTSIVANPLKLPAGWKPRVASSAFSSATVPVKVIVLALSAPTVSIPLLVANLTLRETEPMSVRLNPLIARATSSSVPRDCGRISWGGWLTTRTSIATCPAADTSWSITSMVTVASPIKSLSEVNDNVVSKAFNSVAVPERSTDIPVSPSKVIVPLTAVTTRSSESSEFALTIVSGIETETSWLVVRLSETSSSGAAIPSQISTWSLKARNKSRTLSPSRSASAIWGWAVPVLWPRRMWSSIPSNTIALPNWPDTRAVAISILVSAPRATLTSLKTWFPSASSNVQWYTGAGAFVLLAITSAISDSVRTASKMRTSSSAPSK